MKQTAGSHLTRPITISKMGGAHLGLGLALLVSAAWTGIALTPALILNSLLGTNGLLGGLLSFDL